MSDQQGMINTDFGIEIRIQKDIMVDMRDGVRLSTDVYRPIQDEPVPALPSIGPYNKELQSPEFVNVTPPQPAWSPTWGGPVEAGDTPFFVSNGYAHVISTPEVWHCRRASRVIWKTLKTFTISLNGLLNRIGVLKKSG